MQGSHNLNNNYDTRNTSWKYKMPASMKHRSSRHRTESEKTRSYGTSRIESESGSRKEGREKGLEAKNGPRLKARNRMISLKQPISPYNQNAYRLPKIMKMNTLSKCKSVSHGFHLSNK